jgi:hypothetical protein
MAHIRDPNEPVPANREVPRGLSLFKTDFELEFESDFC